MTTCSIPRGSKKTDWKAELGVVIGKKAKYVSEAEAPTSPANASSTTPERACRSARDPVEPRARAATFGPAGPWLVAKTRSRTRRTKMWLKLNGKKRQDGSTEDHSLRARPILVSYLSQFMSLLPGDIISTGTPPGVILDSKPPKFLKNGDVVELGIEGLARRSRSSCGTSKAWLCPSSLREEGLLPKSRYPA